MSSAPNAATAIAIAFTFGFSPTALAAFAAATGADATDVFVAFGSTLGAGGFGAATGATGALSAVSSFATTVGTSFVLADALTLGLTLCDAAREEALEPEVFLDFLVFFGGIAIARLACRRGVTTTTTTTSSRRSPETNKKRFECIYLNRGFSD
jgi:hypothetical protein